MLLDKQQPQTYGKVQALQAQVPGSHWAEQDDGWMDDSPPGVAALFPEFLLMRGFHLQNWVHTA